jgi:hypothetical protein
LTRTLTPRATAQAAQCKEPAAQVALLRRIDDMSAEVADAGISLKYSKKACPSFAV